MKKADFSSSYLVYLRGAGNPDFRQYADIAPTQIKLVNSIEQAQQICQEYIVQYELGGGNWYTLETPKPGDVYDIVSGNLVTQIAYNGSIHEPEEKSLIPPLDFNIQFHSWIERQANRLEKRLQSIGAREIITEDWTGSYDDPAVITFCKSKCSITSLVAAAKTASAYIHIGWIGLNN
jgi:hypothetical protein